MSLRRNLQAWRIRTNGPGACYAVLTGRERCMSEADPLTRFLEAVRPFEPRTVLEIGTLQSVPGRSTHHMSHFPGIDRAAYTMADIKLGPDVDVVANLHDLPAEW